MGIVLRVTSGPHTGQEYSVDRPRYVHGRAVVARPVSRWSYDLALSREHFQIDNEPPLCHLVDLGSTNGTKVNGLRVGRVLLRDGDVITAGDSAFLVHFIEDSKDALNFATCAGCGGRIPIGSTRPRSDRARSLSRLGQRRGLALRRIVRPAGSSFPRTHPDYLIEEWIGGGGMGEVFRARQLSRGRPVAIKMISANNALGDKASGYFRREIEVLRDLLMPGGQCHPSIVAFYEIYEVDSQFQLVMEYVDGKNALDWIKGLERPLPIASARPDRPSPAVGARLRSFQGIRAPRRQAVEPAGDGPGPPAPGQADRFRTGQELRRDRGLQQPDPPGRHRRIDRLHLARSHPRVQRYPRARRHLLRRRDVVLPADEQVPLPGIRPARARLLRDHPPASPRPACARFGPTLRKAWNASCSRPCKNSRATAGNRPRPWPTPSARSPRRLLREAAAQYPSSSSSGTISDAAISIATTSRGRRSAGIRTRGDRSGDGDHLRGLERGEGQQESMDDRPGL